MLIPDRFEIGFSKKMVCWVLFGVKYQILATKTKMPEKQLFLECMFGHFGALMVSPPTCVFTALLWQFCGSLRAIGP